MKVTQAMENYFNKLLFFWEDQFSSFPKISFEEDIESWMYVGVPDEEESVQWRPRLKTTKEDFTLIERELGMKLHPSIKEYFDSFWFLNLQGFYGSNRITLEEVIPNKDILAFFTNQMNFEVSAERKFDYILIGYISPDDQGLLLDNRTGEIVREDYETNELLRVASSLSELIDSLRITK
ncbi:SecY-interacting protein Syd [Paenibacillus xylanexedens]|uniref:SecY-interacting protein Syd n=1 Tax=Paenibacillus xylanexedens TaxID=528191 RepID=UPI0011A40EFC|nr:SecY-interacting protein Syd [Paenibacillus xylanexedens]